jgi:hypothetical protein
MVPKLSIRYSNSVNSPQLSHDSYTKAPTPKLSVRLLNDPVETVNEIRTVEYVQRLSSEKDKTMLHLRVAVRILLSVRYSKGLNGT